MPKSALFFHNRSHDSVRKVPSGSLEVLDKNKKALC